MTARRVIAFVAVPIVVGLASFGWYGLRQILYGWLVDAHAMSIATVSTVMTGMSWGRAFALFVGGVAGALVGPYVAASVGLVLMAVGAVAIALAPNDGSAVLVLWAGLAVATFGNGLAVTGLWAGLASTFARPAHGARDAAMLVAYAAVQVGATAGSTLISKVTYDWGFGPLYVHLLFASAGASLFAAVMTAGMAASHLVLPPVPEGDPSERFDGRLAGLALVAGVLCLVPYAGYGVATDSAWGAAYLTGSVLPPLMEWVNPVVVLLACVTMAAVAGGLAVMQVDTPSLLVVGAGFLACAVGGTMAAGATQIGGGQIWVLLAAMALLGLGEALIQPLLLSRLLGDLHWRIAAFYTGLWFAASTFLWSVTYAAMSTVGATLGPMIPLLAGAAVCSVGGLVVLAGAVPYQRAIRALLDEPAPEVPEVSV